MHSGAPFIGKPFTPDLLVRKIREVLDYRSPFARPSAPARPVLAWPDHPDTYQISMNPKS